MDSEGETIDDLEFETRTTDADGDDDADIDEDILDALEGDAVADDATDGDDDSVSDTSDDDEDDEDDESEPSAEGAVVNVEAEPPPPIPQITPSTHTADTPSSQSQTNPPLPQPDEYSVVPQVRKRSPSPAQLRKKALLESVPASVFKPRTYSVEAICAIPHTTPTHSLASSLCMSHLLTGSDDGYIRDFDIFAGINGKITLSAPQRHHCGVVEGTMKAAQIRFWWENQEMPNQSMEDPSLSPVYSLAMHSDALWTLAGTKNGNINLFTVRHEPGQLSHIIPGHRGPVSALSLDHNEQGFFSAGWDGEAFQWDLNTGQMVRKFTAHGAQLVGIAVRPLSSPWHGMSSPPVVDLGDAFESSHGSATPPNNEPVQGGNAPQGGSTDATQESRQAPTTASVNRNGMSNQQTQDPDARSDTSYDPLFDEPDAEGEADNDNASREGGDQTVPSAQMNAANGAIGSSNHFTVDGTAHSASQSNQPIQTASASKSNTLATLKNMPPVLDSATYATFSPDILMTAAINGQVMLWDKRINSPGRGVGRLWMSEKTPPWCVSACWSVDGRHIYAGRRNGTVDVWDVRQLGRTGPANSPKLLKSLRNPPSSGVVSCVVPFPDGRHIACASIDNIRLWNAAETSEEGRSRGGMQFKIIPGHHGGYISQMIVDPAARFLVTASSNRGWHGDSTRTVFVHDIKPIV